MSKILDRSSLRETFDRLVLESTGKKPVYDTPPTIDEFLSDCGNVLIDLVPGTLADQYPYDPFMQMPLIVTQSPPLPPMQMRLPDTHGPVLATSHRAPDPGRSSGSRTALAAILVASLALQAVPR